VTQPATETTKARIEAIGFTVSLRRMLRMRHNVLLLSLCQALMMTGNSLIITTSALVGLALAEDKSLATLPLALQFLATMLTTIPASLLMRFIGRQFGFIVGVALGLTGAVLATYAIYHGLFALFCVATAFIGAFNGFAVYYRFAAVDTASEDYRGRAISYVMAGGVIAAFLGPNLASFSREFIVTAEFAGSYLALIGVYALSFVALLFIDIPRPSEAERAATGRPLSAIARQPAFLVAVVAGALGYGTMSLVMTATPLAMHDHAYTFGDTAFVIQWHVFGMFAPSFFTGNLIRRFGVLNVLLTGALCNAVCILINLSGQGMWQIWSALVLLGIGWNFLFVGATTLLTETYRPAEKAKTQAINDFLVIGVVTAAVLSAGTLQHHLGWQAVNIGVTPLIAVIVFAVVWLKLHTRRRLVRVASTDADHVSSGLD